VPGTDSECYANILRLRAVRSFSAEPVGRDDLERVLEAARWTGSSKNRQDWTFVVLDDPEARRRVAATGDFTDPMLAAPVAVALVQEPGGYEFDMGRVAQNMMLAADAIGLASCPVTLHRDADAAAALGLPRDRRCRYAIALGHPGPGGGRSRFGGRKPLEELVGHNLYPS
jgi:nitroreductase